jgi:hypothetical protein
VDEDEDRAVVMAVERVRAYSRVVPQPCGCCVEDEPEEDELTVWVAAPEPVEVILAGGGTTKAVSLVEWWGKPSNTAVLRPSEELKNDRR